MTTAPPAARRAVAPLVERAFTEAGADPFDLVGWGRRSTGGNRVAPACEDVEAPVGWSNLSVGTAARAYLGGVAGSSVRELVARVAGAISGWALDSGLVAGADEREALHDELAALVLTQRASFATPVMLNAGRTPQPLTSACFILDAEDSIPALLDWNTREGLIFQQGGGAGINLSRVRSSREPVSGGGLASGPVSFMRATDAWAATIRAGGRVRRGAKMVVLDATHPDVREFVEVKAREEERGRALVAAGYPVEEVAGTLAFQHANHSVRVTDELMLRALDRRTWALRAVTTGEVVETLPAGELLRACADAAWRCGDPGLQFADAIASWHTCPAAGPITASNPCGEFLHVADSACNLATLNLLAFLDGGRFDASAFVSAVDALVVALDAIVDGSGYPSAAIAEHAHRLRPIGLGFANLGALLLSLGIPYDSDAGRGWAAAIAALMTGAAYRRSAELAGRHGAFADFEANRAAMLRVVRRHASALDRVGPAAPRDVLGAARQQWREAQRLGRLHGFRNAQTTLIPPTGTVSLVLGCETTGVEPYFALVATKRFADGGEARLDSRALADGLAALGHSTRAIEALGEYALDHGHLEGAPGLRAGEADVFRTAAGAHPIAPIAQLRTVAAVQPFVSGGVSKTVQMPASCTVDDVRRTFLDAWRLGLKAVAVYRDGSKLTQPLRAAAL